MTGKFYINGQYLCDTNGLPEITATPHDYTPVDDIKSLLPDMTVTFTAKCKFSKAFKRAYTCKSRKRFLKKLMSLGYTRNDANYLADFALLTFSYKPYEKMYIRILRVTPIVFAK